MYGWVAFTTHQIKLHNNESCIEIEEELEFIPDCFIIEDDIYDVIAAHDTVLICKYHTSILLSRAC
jgi:hypothetical protein